MYNTLQIIIDFIYVYMYIYMNASCTMRLNVRVVLNIYNTYIIHACVEYIKYIHNLHTYVINIMYISRSFIIIACLYRKE